MAKPIKKLCPSCQKMKHMDEYAWSKRRNRPNIYCRACWDKPYPRLSSASESTTELSLLYSPIRSLMQHINEAQAEAAAKGLPVDRPIASLGDVWVGEMTQEAYRAIVQALIRKAESGDVNAAKLLLEERHRRLGEPTPESVEESFADLLKIAPLTPGLDSA